MLSQCSSAGVLWPLQHPWMQVKGAALSPPCSLLTDLPPHHVSRRSREIKPLECLHHIIMPFQGRGASFIHSFIHSWCAEPFSPDARLVWAGGAETTRLSSHPRGPHRIVRETDDARGTSTVAGVPRRLRKCRKKSKDLI